MVCTALGAESVLLFGSRARGDNRERSDIDIAVFGLVPELHGEFIRALEELPTLLEFDVSLWMAVQMKCF